MGFTKKPKNGYYKEVVFEWNLPTGWSCPNAAVCVVKVNRETGKQDNQSSQYKCYAASAERFPGVRKSRWGNFEVSKNGELPELPKSAKAVRIHSSGDFFSQEYFDLWIDYCNKYPGVEFWAYTKSVKYWVERLGNIPNNLELTASRGGKDDDMIEEFSLKNVVIVSNPTIRTDLPTDTIDDMARGKSIKEFRLIDNNLPNGKM